MLTTRLGGSLRALALAVPVLLVLAAPVAAQVPQKALECNSEIQILLGTPTAVSGGHEIPVTLTVVNGLSRDAVDTNVTQDFSQVNFRGSCTMTGPCMPDAALPLTYVAGSYNSSATNSCPGNTGVVPSGGDVAFDFATPFTLMPSTNGTCPPAAADPSPGEPNPHTTCDCVVEFRMLLTSGAMPASGNTGFPVEATTMGTCDFLTGFQSSASATTILNPVPTMGEAALLALTFLMLAGAAAILRRRSVAGGLAGI